MTTNLPAHDPAPRPDAGSGERAPVPPLAATTYATALPSMLVGCYLLGALIFTSMRGDEDTWGIGPFVFVVSLVLIALSGIAMELARHGRIVERQTSRRSVWSVLGMAIAIVAAVPAAGFLLLVR